ncbi:MAG: phenylacetate--CoA ligase [Acidimicrobiia bacterium]|nr:MAG: phenylacetate--CoA ligase [Acidimicrobiia bacterium]
MIVPGVAVYLEEVETLDRASLTQLQSRRLVALIQRLRQVESPYWSEKLAGVGDVGSIEDLAAFPFTEKPEFRDTYPYGMLAVPMSEVVRIHASSGTSGKPSIVAYTAADIEIFAQVNARALSAVGATSDDVVHVAYGYGLFTGGLGLHYGIEELGATAVPASGGNPGFQVGLMADAMATGLASTPSFALILAERAEAAGVRGDIGLRWGIHGAEPWSEGLREKLEQAWGGGYEACDIYGLSEVIGPGVAVECRENKGGMHVLEDHFYPEIVDPETGDPMPEGEPGELVLTTLSKQAQPVLRYRTRDITRMLSGDCPCGRTSRRIARLEGRVDDMLIIRGINVYPRTIETVLMDDPALGANYAIVVDRRGPLPELEARVEVANASLTADAEAIGARLEKQLKETVRLRIPVIVGEPGSVPRSELGKAKRVFERTGDGDPLG